MTDETHHHLFAEHLLPPDILARASRRGNEYAWPVDDIPLVIAAAKDALLASVGGQLQFRLPDGATCECYWVNVDVGATPGSSWPERVEQSARIALEKFEDARSRDDLLREGMTFPSVAEAATSGTDLESAMCFVWYLVDEHGST